MVRVILVFAATPPRAAGANRRSAESPGLVAWGAAGGVAGGLQLRKNVARSVEITEVRIKLMENSDDRLQAFCSITFDNCFVVRDLKIIEGARGRSSPCPAASSPPTAYVRSQKSSAGRFCNHCGGKLREDRTLRDPEGRAKLYADIAHPINSLCREMIQNRVISEFQGAEMERSQQPGYVSDTKTITASMRGKIITPYPMSVTPQRCLPTHCVASLARKHVSDRPHAESEPQPSPTRCGDSSHR